MITTGSVLRINYGEGNVNNCTVHICAILEGQQVIYRRWLRSKKNWHYMTESMNYFKSLADNGNLKRLRKEK